jgi:hypothetical protein
VAQDTLHGLNLQGLVGEEGELVAVMVTGTQAFVRDTLGSGDVVAVEKTRRQ